MRAGDPAVKSNPICYLRSGWERILKTDQARINKVAINDRNRTRLTIPDVVSFCLHAGHPAHNAGSVIPKGQAGPIITNVTESSTLLQEPGLVRVCGTWSRGMSYIALGMSLITFNCGGMLALARSHNSWGDRVHLPLRLCNALGIPINFKFPLVLILAPWERGGSTNGGHSLDMS